MLRVLANDGIHSKALEKLNAIGCQIYNQKVSQADLSDFIQAKNIEVLLVRSATKVDASVISEGTNLKLVIRGGVGLDNVDLALCEANNVQVYNTPGASSQSVAELTIAHILSMARFLYLANRRMPDEGTQNLKVLKKEFSQGFELKGKRLGIIGFGRIGKEVAKIASVLGMQVVACNSKNKVGVEEIDWSVGPNRMHVLVQIQTLDYILQHSDIITLHMPLQPEPVISNEEFNLMQSDTILVNVGRGGLVDEEALLKAIEKGTILRAALDVFQDEPNPKEELLKHSKISLTPHIGASTVEAQERIGDSIVRLIEQYISKNSN